MDYWTYRAIPALAAIVVGATCVTVAAEQKRTPTFGNPYGKEWRSPAIGGGGGGAFTAGCGENHFLAGIEVTKDDRIKTVRPICVEYVDGRLGKPERGKAEYGTRATAEERKICPSSAPVVNRALVYADGFDTIGVWSITLRCATFGARQPIDAKPPHITVEGRKLDHRGSVLALRYPRTVSAAADCPSGYLANGLHGRYGLYIDAIGITCARLPTNAPGQALDVSYYHRLATTFRGSGMSLDVINGGPRNNFTRLNNNGNFNGQMWALRFVSEGTYRLHTEYRGAAMCLELIDGGPNNNQPQFMKCSTSQGQLWKLDAEGSTYRITNALRGPSMCLDIINGGANNNQPELRKCGNFTGQRWLVTRTNRNAPLRGVN